MSKSACRFTVKVHRKDQLMTKVVNEDSFTIGRSVDCAICLSEDSISRVHLLVSHRNNEILIEDKGSSNGTFLNDIRIAQNTLVNVVPSDNIRIGKSEYVLSIQVDAPSEEVPKVDEEVMPMPAIQKVVSKIAEKAPPVKEEKRSGDVFIHKLDANPDPRIAPRPAQKVDTPYVENGAMFEGERVLHEAHKKAAQIIYESEAKAEKRVQAIYIQAREKQAEADSFYQKKISQAHKEADAIIVGYQNQGQELIHQARKFAEEMRDEVDLYVQNLREKAKQEVEDILLEAKQEADTLKNENYEKALSKAAMDAEDMVANAKSEAQDILGFAKLQADEMLTTARNEIQGQIKDLQQQADEKQRALNTVKKDLENFTVKIQADQEAHETRMHEWGERFKVLMTEVEEAEVALATAQTEEARLAKEIADHQEQAAREVAEHREQFASEIAADREQSAKELSAHRERISNELATHRETIASELSAHKELIAKELTAHKDLIAEETAAHRETISKETSAHKELIAKEISAHKDLIAKELAAHKERIEKESGAHKEQMAKEAGVHKDEVAKLKTFIEDLGIGKKTLESRNKELQEQLGRFQLDIQASEDKKRQLEMEYNQQKTVLRDRLEKENKQLSKEAEERMQDAHLEIGKRMEKMERELFEEIISRKDKITKEVLVVVETRIAKVLEPSKWDEVSSLVYEGVQAVIEGKAISFNGMPNAPTQSQSLKRKRQKEHMRWLSGGVVVGVALVFGGLHVENMVRKDSNPMRTIANEESRKKKEDLERRKFNPPQVSGAKDTYVDSVIYTSGFVTKYQDPDYQQKLYKAASAYLLKTWRVDEDKSIQVLSIASALVKELYEKKQAIHPDFVKDGIAKMRALEKSSSERMKAILGSEVRLESFRRFENKFFDEEMSK